MVVVMPPLAEGNDPHPPVVAREIAGVVLLVAPHVARRVHEPGDVVHEALALGRELVEVLEEALVDLALALASRFALSQN